MLERPDDLRNVTHLVLDEVHERSIDSDFLLIVLRRLMLERPDLKVVLMSATLDAERFSNYLGGAPICNVPGRTFPVEVKFLEDAVELTGYSIEDSHNAAKDDLDADSDDAETDNDKKGKLSMNKLGPLSLKGKGYSQSTEELLKRFDEYQINYDLMTLVLSKIATDRQLEQYSKAILVFMPGMFEIRRLTDRISSHPTFTQGWVIHQLHSSVASEDQEKVFLTPPNGMRKIVIATNIAETGITIPDVTAVVDSGKEKVMRFDERRQLSRLVESFISRANAKQRRGRAGRVQSGICFHLFRKDRHDRLLSEQQTPEMLRLSLQDLVLRVKMCNLGGIENALSEALDPPSSKNIRRAIEALKDVKALTNAEDLTPLGRQLARLPLDVFLGKLVLNGLFFQCLDVAVTIAAIMSSKSPFGSSFWSKSQVDNARLSFKKGDSDLITLYNAYCAWKRVRASANTSEFQFCLKNCLSPKALAGIEDLKLSLCVALVDGGFLRLDGKSQASLKRYEPPFFSLSLFEIDRADIVVVPAVLLVDSATSFLFRNTLIATATTISLSTQ
jgi:ATP-dependent RNA helicase DHX29